MRPRHYEHHRTRRIGWLRAAVLGANDGIVSTASLILGVAAAHASREAILTAGVASLVAGAMSMAAGEYVSVSSQSDMEAAETETERRELETDHEAEHNELTNLYVKRGLTPHLAHQVAEQLMAHDALDAHLRDELGISETLKARPLQAAFTSAITFAAGSALPLLSVVVAPPSALLAIVPLFSLIVLTALGGVAARAGGAGIVKGALRVLFWGAIAMAVTAGLGALFGAVA
ncbi:MAG: VIT family protein [Xanthomonadaceae bacterium]|nr:VIT family protein [Xanthomonadaceae bacterium]